MKNLPYTCKELINLYTLNTLGDYETLQEVNKIIDYEPCIYSDPKLQKAKRNYEKKMFIFNYNFKIQTSIALKKLENVGNTNLNNQRDFNNFLSKLAKSPKKKKEKEDILKVNEISFWRENRFLNNGFQKKNEADL